MKLSKLSAVVVVVASLPFAAAATPPHTPRQPWEWTTAERIAARRDPEKRRERVQAAADERRKRGAQDGPMTADVLDGNRNPELFFPTELFEHLVRSWAVMPEVWPKIMSQRATDLFRNPDEWERFAASAADYAALLRDEHGAARAQDQSRVAEIHMHKCAVSARALREARRAFGRERFDRMLYEAVAPGLLSARDVNADGSDWSIDREERCQ